MTRKQRSVTKRGDPSSARPAGRLWLLKWLMLLALLVLLCLWLLYPRVGSADGVPAETTNQSSFNNG
jgi:hypothetical protein